MEDRLPRKLAAILYADVAGYSRLTGEDEDATHRTLSEYLDLISSTIRSHRGEVIHYAGDAVLARFDAVVDALSSAVTIQNEVYTRNQEVPEERKVQFRIGVNLGDVIEDRGDIYGDGVNVAARLESLANSGGICISDAVRTAVGKKLELVYEDLGEREFKNIEKPVRAYHARLQPGAELAAPTVTPKPAQPRRRYGIAATAVMAILIGGGVLVWLEPWAPTEDLASTEPMTLPLPDKPSVAVLPFDNLSDDSEQGYFADGLTEDLITNLSLYRELFVIARNSSFVYKGKAVDVKQVGRELGVAFVVEGSVRREENRVRINAQLIDARSGSHVWAERFDREFTDVFNIQDEITRSIAGRLAPEMTRARVEESRTKPTEDLDAWDLYLQATAAQAEFTREALERAIRLAETAIARDADFAAPHIVVARAKGWQFFYRWTDNPERTLAEAIESARTAIRLDTHNAAGFAALGYLHRFPRDETVSVANLERAVALNPNDANIRLEFAHTLDWFRLQKLALPQILEAIRLSPRDPRLQMMYFFKAHILFHLRDYEASLDAAKEMSGALTSDPWRANYHLIRAANLAQLGRAEEARVEIDNARAVNPKLSLATIRQLFNIANNHPENRRIWLDSLRKAGMPE